MMLVMYFCQRATKLAFGLTCELALQLERLEFGTFLPGILLVSRDAPNVPVQNFGCVRSNHLRVSIRRVDSQHLSDTRIQCTTAQRRKSDPLADIQSSAACCLGFSTDLAFIWRWKMM